MNAGLSHERSVQHVNYQEGGTYLSQRAGPLTEGINVFPLSSLVTNDVCFMKVDVEGLEMNVFQGCGWACMLYRLGAVLVEVAPARWSRGGVSMHHALRIAGALASVNKFGMFLICRQDQHCPCTQLSELPYLRQVKDAGATGLVLELEDNALEHLFAFMKSEQYDCNMWLEHADTFRLRIASLDI